MFKYTSLRTSGRVPLARRLLACPMCTSAIDLDERQAICRRCGFARAQNDPRFVDLRPPEAAEDRTDWQRRQSLMESWYGALSRDLLGAFACFDWDYSGLGGLLASVRGTVVDIGGGLGLTRDYIDSFDHYVIVEPSISWLDERWNALANRFPCLEQPVDLVRGVGERLPLRQRAFDTALALWSLNHASQPGRVVEEAHRVLRPGGRLVAVLEDITPTDDDLQHGPELARLRPQLQDDHSPFSERDFAEHADPRFELVERRWVRHYLGLVLIRRNSQPDDSTRAA